jgi:hypothetical protein
VIDPAARARIERWKLSLLDLSTSNRLLDAARGRVVPLPDVDPDAVLAALARGASVRIEADGAAAELPGAGDGDPAPRERERGAVRLRCPLPPGELARRLRALARASRAQLADRGVHTLWLGIGVLHWCDADGDAHAAPLWLVPAALARGADGELELTAVVGIAPRANATLAERLRRDHGIALLAAAAEAAAGEAGAAGDGEAAAGELEELEAPVAAAALARAAAAIAAARPGWRVEGAAVLGSFSFAKLAMWHDLDAHAEALLQSPVVRHLAAGGGTAFAQPAAAAAAAVIAAPSAALGAADLVCPLDADASQLAAVAAADAGASFVLQGPPGTGKSQTIANLVAHCMSTGRTVLVVTQKLAALDVVSQRLAAVGLGDFCLDLGSPRAGRAQVVAQLGRVLERAFRPAPGRDAPGDRLAELRDALDAHAAALHRVGPLGLSLHAALARLVELRTVPRAALADPDATGLDGAALARRLAAVTALAAAAGPVEPVAAHPWRRSTLERLALDGRERAAAALDEAAAAAAELTAAVAELVRLVPGLVARTPAQLAALGALARLGAGSPRPGAELLTQLRAGRSEPLGEQLALLRARGGGTLDPPRDPLAFAALATRHRALASEVGDRFTERVSELDAVGVWGQLKRWMHRAPPVRFVALRRARAAVREAAIPGLLTDDAAAVTALEAVIAERAARAALEAAAGPARRWLGALGGDPLALDLPGLDAAIAWAADLRRAFDAVEVTGGEAERAAAWRALVAQVAAQPAASPADLAPLARAAAAVARWQAALGAAAAATGIAAADLAAGPDHLAVLREAAGELKRALGAHADWIAFHAARRAAIAAGVGPAVAAIERGDLGAAELALAWERATLLAWADAELAETPALARFHGPSHHAAAAAFADLDRAALALVRARALARLAERVPRVPTEPGGELGLLLHELKKQRGHRPLRRLLAAIPTLLPRLAPCFLMSPASVAQYLAPAAPGAPALRFDVVVLDEASQLPTADAVGALARGDAAIVVGDSRQLPPTRFFQAERGADADDADDADADAELESVLDACVAARLPELRLAWHYRSRHEDLIAFANARYYGDRLQVFPAAQGSPDLGVSWRRVPGVYDRGGTRTNRIEAAAVVAELCARLRDPAQRTRSIAVVACSRAQQELIEDLFDEACAASPDLAAQLEAPAVASGAARDEPVLIKSLETIQGDERDVVLLSIGYGPDEAGTLTRNFGPLSQRGGERRLNVAITRAREQLVVLSSFAPEDLGADVAGPLADLAALLAFARAGGGAARHAEGAAPAGSIPEAVARALAERGWEVRHRVGCGAYQVELAVVDPSDPARYILAIEHDGPMYASAPAARDRDRLRAQVLGQLGWRLHRIWTLDWWADPERELQRAHAALVTALAASRQRRAALGSGPVRELPAARGGAPGRAPGGRRGSGELAAGSGPTGDAAAPGPRAAATAPLRVARGAIPIGPYTVAAIPAGRRVPEDLFAPRHLAELGKIVEQVLAAEAPIHLELLARRVAAYFGIGRVTQRVADQVRLAVHGRGRLGDEDEFVWRMDQDPGGVPPVRVAGTGPTSKREIHEVPLAELAAAARIVVERAVGIGAQELARDTARLLGFSRLTEQVTARVAAGLELARARALIAVESGRASLPD